MPHTLSGVSISTEQQNRVTFAGVSVRNSTENNISCVRNYSWTDEIVAKLSHFRLIKIALPSSFNSNAIRTPRKTSNQTPNGQLFDLIYNYLIAPNWSFVLFETFSFVYASIARIAWTISVPPLNSLLFQLFLVAKVHEVCVCVLAASVNNSRAPSRQCYSNIGIIQRKTQLKAAGSIAMERQKWAPRLRRKVLRSQDIVCVEHCFSFMPNYACFGKLLGMDGIREAFGVTVIYAGAETPHFPFNKSHLQSLGNFLEQI